MPVIMLPNRFQTPLYAQMKTIGIAVLPSSTIFKKQGGNFESAQ
jgi:hypothetical protein